ncbi:MAG: GNAT family N-acetyltransferase [Deltaproteobacteria bacterium]|nr:GNAT family N-acetyltransferase [Deltaproteobacteria bacterium]
MDEFWYPELVRAGDENQLSSFITSVSGRRITPEHWQWKFQPQMSQKAIVVLARSKANHEIIGHYSGLPCAINYFGKAIAGSLIVDLLTLPQYRRMGICDVLSKCFLEACKDQGLQFVMGFPNEKSLPLHVKKLGFRSAAVLKHYEIEVERVESSLGESEGLCLNHEVPPGYSEFWEAYCSKTISLWKDLEYLRWRYDLNPIRDFIYFCIYRDNLLKAMAVGTFIDETLRLCELMIRHRDIPLGRNLVNAIAAFAKRKRAAKVIFSGTDGTFYDDVLLPNPSSILPMHVLVVRMLKPVPIEDQLMSGHPWAVSLGDFDTLQ